MRGRDVVLDLLDAVQALRTGVAQQRGLLEEHGLLLDAHSELQSRLLASSKRQEGHLARVAKLLGTFADDTTHRFDDLERRVGRLEAAS